MVIGGLASRRFRRAHHGAEVRARADDRTQALQAHAPATREVYACGGGVHNAALMDALRHEMRGMHVDTTAALGIDPDFVEAAGFAWLARARLEGIPGNLPSVTGARGPRLLGAVYSGR